jgi:hypothetical protein
MLFANLEHPEINNTFEDNIISTIESHRHLGVAFNTDAKWNAHMSSANSLVREVNLSVISFIYIINSKGAGTKLWGTPP